MSGKNGVGGISGVIYSFGTIEGCYHQGNVSTISETGKDIGGIVGWLQAGFSENAKGNAVVKSCYNIGSVSGTEKYSSIVGEVFDGDDHDGNVIVENCYSIKGEAPATTNGECTTYDVTTLSESMLKKAASELGSAFTTAPSNDANNGYPVFKWQSYTPLLNWLLGNPDTIITESNWKDFDLNNDGKLNAIDLTLMKRNLLKAGT